MEAEGKAEAGLAARMRQHRIARWGADRLACPLGHDQQDRKLPVIGHCQERHRGKIDNIAKDGHRPIDAAAVAEIAGHKPQCITKEFAKPRDKTDDGGTRSEDPKIRAGDAARAFIGHVREEADHAE